MLKQILKINLTDRAVPAILLFATVLSFGLLIPWLGFYWDDWPVIYLTHTQGIHGFWAFYQYDRPFSAWTYILLAPILGTNSIAWYAFVLGLRWVTAIFVWLLLRIIWPKKHHQVFWIALLFAVCPLFVQQQVVVAYSQHWICYLFYLMSLYLMLKAHAEPRFYYRFTTLAVFLTLVQLFTMEYFIGLELLRPFVLWMYLSERNTRTLSAGILWSVIKSTWAYFAVLLLYVIWRLFFLHLPENNVNNPVLLSGLLQAPFQVFINLFEKALQDYLYLLISWVVSVNPVDINLRRPFSLAVLVILLFAFICSTMFLRRYRPIEIDDKDDGWCIQALLFGTLAILLGVLPVWVIGRQVTLGGDRFSFAAMFGVCIVMVGLLEWLSSRQRAKITVVCVFLALAVHTNLYTAKRYQLSWERQQTFYWQLFWRAPYIQPGTAFIADGEIFPYVGRYSTSMGITLLYPTVSDPQNVPYWFFDYWEGLFRIPDELVKGRTITEGIRNYSFSGDSKNALLINFVPEASRCLEIFSPQDVDLKEMPQPLKGLAGISNLQRIARTPLIDGWLPPKVVFGSEPRHEWCYYYQKAELARQYQDWGEVVRLLQVATQKGFSPNDDREYLGFIDAYIKLGMYDQATDLTMKVKGSTKKNDDGLCALWRKNAGLQQQSDFSLIYDQVRLKLDCATGTP